MPRRLARAESWRLIHLAFAVAVNETTAELLYLRGPGVGAANVRETLVARSGGGEEKKWWDGLRRIWRIRFALTIGTETSARRNGDLWGRIVWHVVVGFIALMGTAGSQWDGVVVVRADA